MHQITQFPKTNKAIKALEYLINSEEFKRFTQEEQFSVTKARQTLLNYREEE